MLKLDSKENIEKYHYLPLTYFDRIRINFDNLQADKFDIACTILKSIFEQKDNNCELVIDLATVTMNGLIDLLNLFPKTIKVFTSKLEEWNNVSCFDAFTQVDISNLSRLQVWEIDEPMSSLKLVEILRILSQNKTVAQNLKSFVFFYQINEEHDYANNLLEVKNFGFEKCKVHGFKYLGIDASNKTITEADMEFIQLDIIKNYALNR